MPCLIPYYPTIPLPLLGPVPHRDPLWTSRAQAWTRNTGWRASRNWRAGPRRPTSAPPGARPGWPSPFASRANGSRPGAGQTRPEDSDGLQVWIDTRDVHNVHRAGRFCHRFIFLPGGGGRQLDEPVAQWLPINRAREQPRADPARPAPGPQREARGRLLAGGLHPGRGPDRLRSAGASAAGLHLRGDRSRVGRADLRRRQPDAVPGRPEPLGDAGAGSLTYSSRSA